MIGYEEIVTNWSLSISACSWQDWCR